MSYNYLQSPIIFKYQLIGGSGIQFFIQGGHYLGFGIGKIKSRHCEDGDCSFEEKVFGNDRNEISNPDFGFQFGAGLNFNHNLSLDARYI